MPSTHTHSSDEKALDDEAKSSSSPVLAGTTTTTDAVDDTTPAQAGDQWDFSDIDEKKLNRKVDLKIVPWLTFLYLLSFLDRSAIGNAKLFGLNEDLGLKSVEYNICVCIFYFSYAFFEVPSNILLKRLSPPFWFGVITCFVGICMMSQGLVESYGGLLAARFCLGIAEAGLFPGVNFLLSGWYPRSKFGLRAAIFFAGASASGAFGGMLSTGLAQIRAGKYDGTDDGWRWIFVVIGLITFVSGVFSFWFVPDFPDQAKWLTEKERAYVIRGLQANQQHSAAGETFHWSNVWKACADVKTYIAAFMYMGVDGPLYAFSVFTPTIVKSLGSWTAVESNLLTVPIYIVAAIATVIVGFYADRRGNRALIILCVLPISIIGYIILLAVDPRKSPGASYFACYLAAVGIYPLIPVMIALCGSHVEGAYKRSVVMAIFISWGNVNGAATSQVYLARQAPRYWIGHGIVIMYLAIGYVSAAAYLLVIRRSNAQRERGAVDEVILFGEGASASASASASGDTKPPSTLAEAESVAATARAREVAALRAQGGLRSWYRAMMVELHSAPGGTYATLDEARRLKGDAFSGHRYSY